MKHIILIIFILILTAGCKTNPKQNTSTDINKISTTPDKKEQSTTLKTEKNVSKKEYSSKYYNLIKEENLIDTLVGSWGYEGELKYEIIETNNNLLYVDKRDDLPEKNQKFNLIYYNPSSKMLYFENERGLKYDTKEKILIDFMLFFNKYGNLMENENFLDYLTEKDYKDLTENPETYVTKAGSTKIN